MGPGTDETKLAAFDSIYEQPIRFDVAFPTIFQWADKLMILALEWKFLAFNKQIYNAFQLLHILIALDHPLDISLELCITSDRTHIYISRSLKRSSTSEKLFPRPALEL